MTGLVQEVTFIDPNGELKRLSKQDGGDDFTRFLHSFGMLGIVYEIKMDIVPEFWISNCIYRDIPFAELFKDEKSFDSLNYDHDFVSFKTDWSNELVQ